MSGPPPRPVAGAADDEPILAAPREAVFAGETLAFQGLETRPEVVARILDGLARSLRVLRRADAEADPRFKQPIPYAVLRRAGRIFTYRRLAGGGEPRLRDRLSIGVGGHMHDLGVADFGALLAANLRRELDEELEIRGGGPLRPRCLGLINDDAVEVGRYHIGILAVIDLPWEAVVEVRERDRLEGAWRVRDELLAPDVLARLETWSRYALRLV